METSSINQPHPDATTDDAEDFFGVSEAVAEPEAGSFDEPAAEPDTATEPDPDDTQARLRAISEKRAAEAAEPEPEPEPEPVAEVQSPAAAPVEEQVAATEAPAEAPAPVADPAATDSAKKSGALEREYRVFQRVPLTAKVLKHLLTQIEEGQIAEPRVAYLDLHRSEARNDKAAIAEAYGKHKQSLGEKCKLAAVSSRSFKERQVEPKQVVERSLSIT